MGWAIVLSVVIVIIAVVIGTIRGKRLLSEGKTIKREGAFWEDAEDFTISCTDTERVTRGIRSIDYNDMKVTMRVNKQAYQFEGSQLGDSFVAKLNLKESSDTHLVYTFSFNEIVKKGSVLSCVAKMNMLLTAIEKVFVEIDPCAQVKRYEILRTHKTVRY